ncbi:hypothetical protein D3C86_1727480 [compost metagenome]
MHADSTRGLARSVFTMFLMPSSVRPPQRPYPPRVTSTVSSKPSVVTKPTFAPSLVKIALSTTVDPWMNNEVCPISSSRPRPIDTAADRMESSTPSAKFGGVDKALPSQAGSPAANTTVSVQVPPTSVATRYFRCGSVIRCLQKRRRLVAREGLRRTESVHLFSGG